MSRITSHNTEKLRRSFIGKSARTPTHSIKHRTRSTPHSIIESEECGAA